MSQCSPLEAISSNSFLIRHFLTCKLTIQYGASLNEIEYSKYRQLFKKLNKIITSLSQVLKPPIAYDKGNLILNKPRVENLEYPTLCPAARVNVVF
jgi:hypothetical protein